MAAPRCRNAFNAVINLDATRTMSLRLIVRSLIYKRPKSFGHGGIQFSPLFPPSPPLPLCSRGNHPPLGPCKYDVDNFLKLLAYLFLCEQSLSPMSASSVVPPPCVDILQTHPLSILLAPHSSHSSRSSIHPASERATELEGLCKLGRTSPL